MILWDFVIKEYTSGIEKMNPPQQYKFAACCICESISHLIGQGQNSIAEAIKGNLQDSLTLASLIADSTIIPTETEIRESLITDLSDFVEIIDNHDTQIPGLYDMAMALLILVEAIKNYSIEDRVMEIASYAYQAILDEQLMFDLPEGGILESELVHLEENNLTCNHIILSQINWYKKIKNNEPSSAVFEALQHL